MKTFSENKYLRYKLFHYGYVKAYLMLTMLITLMLMYAVKTPMTVHVYMCDDDCNCL
jgi:hypothetical protein